MSADAGGINVRAVIELAKAELVDITARVAGLANLLGTLEGAIAPLTIDELDEPSDEDLAAVERELDQLAEWVTAREAVASVALDGETISLAPSAASFRGPLPGTPTAEPDPEIEQLLDEERRIEAAAAVARPGLVGARPEPGLVACRWCDTACHPKGRDSHERTCTKNPQRPSFPCSKGCGATFHHPPSRASHEKKCTATSPAVAAAPDLVCPCGRPLERRSALGRLPRYCSEQCKRDAAKAKRDPEPDPTPAAPAKAAMYAGKDAEKLTLAAGYECDEDDCGFTADTVVALEGHVRRAHDRGLEPAERHRVRRPA